MLNSLINCDIDKLPSGILILSESEVDVLSALKELLRKILCLKDFLNQCDCKSCALVFKDIFNHPDFKILNVDDGSVGIDEVRRVIDFSRMSSSLSENKVVIIPLAERLTIPAQNALLKAIEEPCPGQYFILSAKKQSDVIPTISSRCVKYNINAFERVDQNDATLSILNDLLTEVLVKKNYSIIPQYRKELIKLDISEVLASIATLINYALKEKVGINSHTKNIVLKWLPFVEPHWLHSFVDWSNFMRKSLKSTKLNGELVLDRVMINILGVSYVRR